MQNVGVIFVSAHNIVGELVQQTTNSQWAHVGIIMPSLGGIVEAVFPRVTVSSVDTYNRIYTEVIELTVTDEQYLAMEQSAIRLIGKFYGFDDCIVGGLHDIFGDIISQNVGRVIDFDGSIDCSATVTTILRDGGFNLFPGEMVSQITPNDLYVVIR